MRSRVPLATYRLQFNSNFRFKKSATESWAAFPSYTSPVAQALSKCLNPQGLSTHRLITLYVEMAVSGP